MPNLNARSIEEFYEEQKPNYSELRRINNPRNEPTGHFTGRCSHCGSNNLWDDNHAYGCNYCGAIFIT